MQFNNIDEIIKTGLYASEKRDGLQALQAKSRIWNAIDKPKRKTAVHWGFVSALAASLTLFIISTFLFLKLESQEKEVKALQALVSQEKHTVETIEEISQNETESVLEEFPIAIPEVPSAALDETSPPIAHHLLSAQPLEEEIKTKDPEMNPNQEVIELEKIPEMEVTEILNPEFVAELNPPLESMNEPESGPQNKSKSKLRFRFGNRSNANSPNKSLAVNIKL